MDDKSQRKLFSLGEGLTLLSMGLGILSGMLAWKDDTPVVSVALGVIIRRGPILITGFDPRLKIGWLPVGWAVVICTVICGTLLLWEPSNREKAVFFSIQVSLSITVLVLGILHLRGPFPGAIVAVIVGLFLLIGAVTRYR